MNMRIQAFVLLLHLACCAVSAQTTSAASSTDEVALAHSAAPPQISEDATIYVRRDGGYVKAVAGKNTFTCLVQRDEDSRSLYPVCMDEEWTRCALPEYLKEVELHKRGMSETQIEAELQKLRQAGA